MQLFLYGGNDPSGLNLGASGAVVANIGSVTVYYNDRTPVDTTNALTAGSTVIEGPRKSSSRVIVA